MTKFSDEDIAEEQRLFLNVVATFEQYETYAVSVSASIKKPAFTEGPRLVRVQSYQLIIDEGRTSIRSH